ncbi:hypothetical protein ABW20_dc0103053 [Dactylellina cionopaga]|nr:hypothetical protein ABW20_dc0103053 [Dactylellina cionopaga]
MRTQTIFNIFLLIAFSSATPLRSLYSRQAVAQPDTQIPAASGNTVDPAQLNNPAQMPETTVQQTGAQQPGAQQPGTQQPGTVVEQEQPATDASAQQPAAGTPAQAAPTIPAEEIKTLIMNQLNTLGIDPEPLANMQKFPAEVFEKVYKLQEPQLTEAVKSLLQGQTPAGI